MQTKGSILLIVLASTVMEIGLSLIILSHLPSNKLAIESIVLASDLNDYQTADTLAAWPVTRPDLPTKLIIPKLNLNAQVEHVGLTPDGEMEVRKEPGSLGWYSLGARPGEVGAAVMAAHSGWKNNIPALFDHLDQLVPGDQIMVDDESGQRLTFVVRESRRYNPDADATEVFSSSDGQRHLNLITCKGIWNKVTKNYSERLVVFADQVD